MTTMALDRPRTRKTKAYPEEWNQPHLQTAKPTVAHDPAFDVPSPPKHLLDWQGLLDLCPPMDAPRRVCLFLERCTLRQFYMVWNAVVADFAISAGMEPRKVAGLAIITATVRNRFLIAQKLPTPFGRIAAVNPPESRSNYGTRTSPHTKAKMRGNP